jgi:hypothetical protein
MKLILIATLATCVAIGDSGAANASITEYVRPQPDAPIQLTLCKGAIQFTSNRWGTNSSSLLTGADFKNVSGKMAIEVVVKFKLSNALGAPMDNILDQATGQFSPDAQINGNSWAQTDAWPGLGEVQCSVARVLFSDGSDWKAPVELPLPSPSPA